jgi:hypothetical protein
MTDVVSSVPGIYKALFSLIEKAAGEQESAPAVFPWELKQYEPRSYIVVSGIKGPRFEWHAIPYQQEEHYSIFGKVSVFTGEAQTPNTEVAVAAMEEVWSLFNACVMTPVVSNVKAPFLGTTGPTPQIMLPEEADFNAGVGIIANGPAGWQANIDWSFSFAAILTPA